MPPVVAEVAIVIPVVASLFVAGVSTTGGVYTGTIHNFRTESVIADIFCRQWAFASVFRGGLVDFATAGFDGVFQVNDNG